MKKALLDIAKTASIEIKQRGDLNYHGNDEEDYLNISVGAIEYILEKAYELGKKDALAEKEANRKLKHEIFRKAVAERNKELMKERGF